MRALIVCSSLFSFVPFRAVDRFSTKDLLHLFLYNKLRQNEIIFEVLKAAKINSRVTYGVADTELCEVQVMVMFHFYLRFISLLSRVVVVVFSHIAHGIE